MRLIEREELPQGMLDVSEARDVVSAPSRLYGIRAVDTVEPVETVARAEDMRDVRPRLIGVDGRRGGTDETGSPGRVDKVGAGDQRDKPGDYRVTGGLALRVAKHQAVEIHFLFLPQSFVIPKEERPAGDEGAAHIAAELVSLERLRAAGGERKKVAGIERLVTHELKQLPVEFIGSRVGRNVDNGPGAMAIFRAEG